MLQEDFQLVRTPRPEYIIHRTVVIAGVHLRSNFRRISFRIPNFHRNFNLSFVLPYKANFQIEIHSPSIDFNLFFFPNNLRGKKKTHTSIIIDQLSIATKRRKEISSE